MAKVILVCGKICSGKSTYSKKIIEKNRAVILSIDEITLAIFGQHIGESHDEVVEKTEKYLFNKSLEILRCGINVILDFGFWTKAERDDAKEFYKSRGIECELHYISVSEDVWKSQIEKRNRAVEKEPNMAYYVDENLAKKFDAIFSPPGEDEIDVTIR